MTCSFVNVVSAEPKLPDAATYVKSTSDVVDTSTFAVLPGTSVMSFPDTVLTLYSVLGAIPDKSDVLLEVIMSLTLYDLDPHDIVIVFVAASAPWREL